MSRRTWKKAAASWQDKFAKAKDESIRRGRRLDDASIDLEAAGLLIAALRAQNDELREALRACLEREIYGGRCSRCGGTWDEHCYVRVDGGGLQVPCPNEKPCLLARHPQEKETGR